LSAGFQEEFRRNRMIKTHKCPHCGEHLDLDDNHEHDNQHK